MLAALKAFYLGYGIASSPMKEQAIEKIKKAIDIIKLRTNHEEKIRHIFYLLLLSEIMRGSSEGLEYRTQAKTISDDAGFNLFEIYMRIVDATQQRVRLDGIGGSMTIAGGSVKNERGYTFGPDIWDGGVSWDYAIVAVGLDDRHITDKEKQFLYKTSLKEIMIKHDIWKFIE